MTHVFQVILISTLLLVCFDSIGQSNSQQVSSEVSIITNKIAASGSLGFDRDQQYNRFLQLIDLANQNELIVLTDHKSPAVRGYAFWALAKKNYPGLRSIFIAHIGDESEVFQKNGCMIGNESVISFMKQVATPYMYDPECMKLDEATLALVK